MRQLVRFPIICPECGTESLLARPLADLARALVSGEDVVLQAPCRHPEWPASSVELDQVQQYLRVASTLPILKSNRAMRERRLIQTAAEVEDPNAA
jgi:hypothetical protein